MHALKKGANNHTTIKVFASNELTNSKRLVYDYEEDNEAITFPPLIA
jgi:hypothetical protein